MRADAFLAAAERLPLADLDAIVGDFGVVVIAPHPDDESLGCAGLILGAGARGIPVRLIVLSDGIGSHRASSKFPPERLRALRERETLDAAEALCLSSENVTFLRLPDGFVPGEGRDADVAAETVVSIARECAAGTLFVTWAHDPHCDHAAAANIARLARESLPLIRLIEYPIWGWTLPSDTEVGEPPRGSRLDIADHLATKRAAIAAHRSQTTDLIDDDPNGFRLSREMVARFLRPFEVYLETRE